MPPPAIEVRGLSKRYRSGWLTRARTALESLDLELAAGGTLGLLGPNGSGKSTLIAILAGIQRPTRGSVRIFGAEVGSREARRRIGYLPDGAPYPPELTPRAVLDLLGSLHGLTRAERRHRADAMLARVGLAHEARVPLARFSLGMKRRFGLCQAWLGAPDLLLLDEPSYGLDALGAVVLEELLGEARARGTTLVLASHVAQDLRQHCLEARVLVGGRLVAHGPSATLAGDPAALLALYRAGSGREPRAES